MAYEERHFEHVHDHRGMSGGAVAALVILAAAVVGLAVFLVMRANNNANQQPVSQTTNVEQPTPQQQPAPSQQPGAAPSTPENRTIVVKPVGDAAIQAEVERRIANAPDLSPLGITARVSDSRVILTGRVNSNNLRLAAERIVRSITGVKALDNQIVVVTRQP